MFHFNQYLSLRWEIIDLCSLAVTRVVMEWPIIHNRYKTGFYFSCIQNFSLLGWIILSLHPIPGHHGEIYLVFQLVETGNTFKVLEGVICN